MYSTSRTPWMALLVLGIVLYAVDIHDVPACAGCDYPFAATGWNGWSTIVSLLTACCRIVGMALLANAATQLLRVLSKGQDALCTAVLFVARVWPVVRLVISLCT